MQTRVEICREEEEESRAGTEESSAQKASPFNCASNDLLSGFTLVVISARTVIFGQKTVRSDGITSIYAQVESSVCDGHV